MTSIHLAVLALVLVLVAPGVCGKAELGCSEAGGISIVSEMPLPDPRVVRDGQGFAVFGTGTSFLYGSDLSPDALKPTELRIDFGKDSPQYQVWAFSPYKHSDGTWHAYATINYGQFRTAVAHFLPVDGQQWRAGRPIAEWRLDSVLLGTDSEDGPFAYDGRVVRDEKGVLYLVYCVSPARHSDVRIQALRLSSPGVIDKSFATRTLLSAEGYRSEDRNPGYIQLVEAPSLSKLGKIWVMLYSVGDFSSRNYKIGLAYSDSLIPPEGKTYTKVMASDPNDVWKSGRRQEVCYLLQSEKPGWPNYCSPLVIGPGAGSIVSIGRDYWLVFHGCKPGDGRPDASRRYVWKARLDVQISLAKPASEWLRVRGLGH